MGHHCFGFGDKSAAIVLVSPCHGGVRRLAVAWGVWIFTLECQNIGQKSLHARVGHRASRASSWSAGYRKSNSCPRNAGYVPPELEVIERHTLAMKIHPERAKR